MRVHSGPDDFAAPPVALYRAKYGITGDRPLGSDAEPADGTQRHDEATARWAIRSSDRRRQLRPHEHNFGLGHGSIDRGGHSIGL